MLDAILCPTVKGMFESRTPQRIHMINRVAKRFFSAKGWAVVPPDGSEPLLSIIQQEDVYLGLTALYFDTSHPFNLDHALGVVLDRLLTGSLCPNL